VRRLFSLIAYLLVALWVPATMHCDLEAATLVLSEIAHSDSSGCCDPASSCSQDACQVVEAANYQSSNLTLKLLNPTLFVCSCMIWLQAADQISRAEPAMPVCTLEKARGWVPTWQFVRRTALPARAPDFVA